MSKKMTGKTLLTALLAAGVLTLTAAGTAMADDGKVLNVAWNSDMATMDVCKTTSNYSVPQNIFDRLFDIKLNEDGSTELVNSLVTDYSVSEDGLTYTFTLRDDVQFSDGTPLTASDVAFTFNRMITLEDSVATDWAASIKGAQACLDGEADSLEGLNVVDDHTIEFTLEEPFAGFLNEMAAASCSIVSEKNVTEAGDDFGIDPAKTIGSGPYVITEWVTNDHVTLEANPNYWGEAPSASTVNIKIVPDPSTLSMMYQSGEIDIIDLDYVDSAIVDSTYKTAYADKLVSGNRLATTYFALNENVEPLNDVNVRKAIQMAIDRQTILDAIYGGAGQLVDGIFPAGLIGYSEENQGQIAYDPEGAKKLLEEAGYADGFEMEISADSSSSQANLNVLQIVAENLAAVGITANIVSYDSASWLDLRKSGEMTSFVSQWTADYNDPDNFIYTFYGNEGNGKLRSLNYPDADVMKRVRDARTIQDVDERNAEYAALEKKIVQEDAAWVPMFSRTHLFAISENVESFVPHWAGYSDFSFSGVTMK